MQARAGRTSQDGPMEQKQTNAALMARGFGVATEDSLRGINPDATLHVPSSGDTMLTQQHPFDVGADLVGVAPIRNLSSPCEAFPASFGKHSLLVQSGLLERESTGEGQNVRLFRPFA